jgi:hypothetical protein
MGIESNTDSRQNGGKRKGADEEGQHWHEWEDKILIGVSDDSFGDHKKNTQPTLFF